jgi:hypothetical protein
MTPTQIDALDARDGPPPEFHQHHEVATRAGGSGGKRVKTRLEQLLLADDISPEEAEAGLRFAGAFLMGCISGSKASFLREPGGSSTGGFNRPVIRSEAYGRYQAAAHAIASSFDDTTTGRDTAEWLRMFVVDDCPFSEIAQYATTTPKTVKRRIIRALGILAGHYGELDAARGKSTTVGNRDAALRRFEPSDERGKSATHTEY